VVGCRTIDLTEFWYEQALWDGRVRFRIGKLDLTGTFECRGCPVSFDGNSFANDETAQFLNAALVNNPTIPFPDCGLGAIVHLEPLEGLYVSAGVADADADAREMGFNTAFCGECNWFSIYEVGVVPHLPSPNGPLPGAYRAGLWYDPRPKETHSGGTRTDDVGFYLSFDQMLLRENADDAQGLGVFARYGYADAKVASVECFWSVGCQYLGLIPTRDADVLGFGVAQGTLVKAAGFTKPQETVFELYYNAAVLPWLSITPSFQYVLNPGGDGTPDAVVFGVRLQISL